jgi:hypothetical protein
MKPPSEGLLEFLSGLDAGQPDKVEKVKATKFSQLGWDDKLFKKWIVNALRIEDKTTNAMLPLGPLLMANRPQAELLFTILKALDRGGPVRFLVLKSRKVGVSTIVVELLLAMAMQLKGITCAILAHTDESSLKLFKIARDSYENLPKDLKNALPTRYNAQDRIQFGNKDYEKLKAQDFGHVALIKSQTAAGQYPLTGDTVRVLHLSECAKYDAVGDHAAQQRFILSALGAVPKLGPSLVIAESTANGQQGWFYNEWQRASKAQADGETTSNWIPLFFSWLEDPACWAPVPHGYDWSRWPAEDQKTEAMLRDTFFAKPEQLYFRRSQINIEMAGNYELFDQEYPTTPSGAFLASGRPAVPRRYIKAMEAMVTDDYRRYTAKVIDSYDSTMTVDVVTERA